MPISGSLFTSNERLKNNYFLPIHEYYPGDSMLVCDAIKTQKIDDIHKVIDDHEVGIHDKYCLLADVVACGEFDLFLSLFAKMNTCDYTLANSNLLRAACDNPEHEDAIKIIKFFLEHGCDAAVDDSVCLKKLVSHQKYYEIKKLLIEYGADVHAESDYCIRIACHNPYSLDDIKFWLDHGANIRVFNDYCLRITIEYCHYERIPFLIAAGCDISPYLNYTLTHCLVESIDGQYIDMLLEMGADINTIDTEDVIQVIRDNDSDKLRVLQKYGFDFRKIKRYAQNYHEKYQDTIKILTDQDIDETDVYRLLLK